VNAGPSRWERLRASFATALDLDPGVRERWLRDLGDADPDFAAELRTLLAAHAAPAGALERGAAIARGLLGAHAGEDADERVGTRVGAYRLLRLLGRGGMGSVYLAERADGQFRQQVALKRIDHDTPTRGLRERFLRERDILARLAHPNIAPLHDGGLDADGVPYFTLEFVEGEPITAWCDTHRLDLAGRVRVLLKVCDAVQCAHRNLVVHRDLKPSNILVNAAGEPKLLDFGIAKFLDADADAMQTDAGTRPMTREYAAPEQVLAQPVTTLTDVYALGVLLYELACGRLPYAGADSGATSWPKAIVDEVPEPLVRALQRPGMDAPGLPEAAAAARGTHAATLRRQLRGDLDAIVQRALCKAPDERHPSVAAFAEALHAWLDGRAQPGARRVRRVQRFLRRHALACAATLVIVATTLAAIGGVLWEARRSTIAGQRAQAVEAFLTSVFDVSDPDRARGQTVTARELLDEGARRANSELADQPALRAELLRLIGSLHARLGLYARALPLQAQGVALLRATDVDAPVLAAALVELAATERLQEHYADAERDLDEALALQRTGAPDALRARTLAGLGGVYADTARNDDAERTLRAALDIDHRLARPPDERGADDEESLARVLAGRAHYAEARVLLADSLDQQRRLHGGRHSSVATTLVELGKLELSAGDLAAAGRDFDDALAMRRALFGDHHPAVADSLYWVAALASYQGRHGDAETLVNEALAIDQDAFGPESAHAASLHDLLAEVAQARNDLDRAESEARSALAIWQRVLGRHHSEMANGLQRLALIERDRGDAAQAVDLLRQALAIRRDTLGTGGERIGFTLANLASTLRIAGQLEEARSTFEEALSVYRASLPEHHLRVVEALAGLGHVQLDAGDVGGAIQTLERARAMAQEVYPPTHPDRARVLLPLGDAYFARGDADAAADAFEAAAGLLATPGESHVRSAVEARIGLARARAAQHRAVDATAALDQAAALLETHPQATHALRERLDAVRRELAAARRPRHGAA